MQLTVNEAARILKVSEDMVYQWIRNDELPATRFGTRYRVNRVKLIEWAHKKSVAMEIEGSIEQPVLENAIAHGDVISNVKVENLEELVQKFLLALPAISGLTTDKLKQYLAIRKEFGLAPGPEHVAVPDARSPVVLPVSAALVQIAYLDTALEIGKRPCSIVFFIAAPSTAEHLNIVTRILFVTCDAQFKALLLQKSRKDVLLARLRALSLSYSPAQSKPLAWQEDD